MTRRTGRMTEEEVARIEAGADQWTFDDQERDFLALVAEARRSRAAEATFLAAIEAALDCTDADPAYLCEKCRAGMRAAIADEKDEE